MFPLCAECLKLDIVRPTDEIDHVVPLSQGGADTDDNCQGLCLEHHSAKSALEDTAHQAASNHPDWLRPSAIPLTIVSGPPCAGKTTYVAEHVRPGDAVIDLDGIMAKLQPGYQQWSGADASLINRAIRARNAMLGSLSRLRDGRAWFIVSAPSKAEREWWRSKLGGAVVLLHPGTDECERRAVRRGTPAAIKGITEWERASRRAWSPRGRARPARVAIGADGWPLAMG